MSKDDVENKPVVCALIVTYNRCECLTRLLDALETQSYPVSEVVIFDNCSTDGTQELLVKKRMLNRHLKDGASATSYSNGVKYHCIRSGYNSGGSGGFHDGLKYASDLECDYIWMMDDDVLPDAECLRELLKYVSSDRKIAIPNRTSDGFVDNAIIGFDMKNPFLYTANLRKRMVSANKITEDAVPVVDMPFEGPLIDVTLIQEIGLPKSELVIIFDDTEYCRRAIKKTEVVFVKSAHLFKQIIPSADHSRLMGWKEYYSYRNQYWFDVTYGQNVLVKIIRPALNVIDLSLRAIFRHKWSNLRVLYKSYVDGVNGRLGITVKPGERV